MCKIYGGRCHIIAGAECEKMQNLFKTGPAAGARCCVYGRRDLNLHIQAMLPLSLMSPRSVKGYFSTDCKIIMQTRLLRIILVSLLCLAGAGSVSPQTIRVSTGVTSDGRRCYREVFEYDYVTEKPTFPGGDSELVAFINTHRTYPQAAYQKGVQGRVTCSFVVNADGHVSNINVIKGVENTLNDEAMRVLSLMPSWLPGRIEGQPVPVRVIWSVPFRK